MKFAQMLSRLDPKRLEKALDDWFDPGEAEMRFTVRTDVPEPMRRLGFVAYVEDSKHPDGCACSMSWHQSLHDAGRVALAMDRYQATLTQKVAL